MKQQLDLCTMKYSGGRGLSTEPKPSLALLRDDGKASRFNFAGALGVWNRVMEIPEGPLLTEREELRDVWGWLVSIRAAMALLSVSVRGLELGRAL